MTNEAVPGPFAANGLDREYRFIRDADHKPPVADAARIAAYIVNRWTASTLTVSRLRKIRRLQLQFTHQGHTREIPLEFEALIEHIRSTRSFRGQHFGLPELECDWLDYSFAIAKPDAPIATVDGSEFAKFALQTPFGKQFPLSPCIDREGAAYASFQQPIQENIVTLHRRLVANSHQTPSLSNTWRNDLRMLLNECVSIVDITLHQLYFMAQYRGHERRWSFDPDALGPRRGVRLEEKLRWVGRITGRPLDDANEERAALARLKAVRNHFNHFDPPCIAYSVEDVVGWLNDVPLVGRLLWKMRDRMDAQLSRGLVEIITLPTCVFVPRWPDWPRIPQSADVGYASTVWPAPTGSSTSPSP